MERLAMPLVEAGWVSRAEIRACTNTELQRLMDVQGVTQVPTSYRQFMEYGGRDPYRLSRGGEWDYEWLPEAKTIAREIVVDDYNDDFTPFEDAFIFQTHQGYSFYYFRPTDLGENDPEFWAYVAKDPARSIGVMFSG